MSAALELEAMQLRQRVADLEFQLGEVTRDRDRYLLRSTAMSAAVKRFCAKYADDSRCKALIAAITVLEGKGLNG